MSHAIYDGVRRTPSFLAKSELFKVPVLGALLRKAGQIPVYRRTRDAVNSLRDAESCVGRRGRVRDHLPRRHLHARSEWVADVCQDGCSALVLEVDVPVIPIAHWGTQAILRYGSKRPHPFPRKKVYALAGEPLDLSRFKGASPPPKCCAR